MAIPTKVGSSSSSSSSSLVTRIVLVVVFLVLILLYFIVSSFQDRYETKLHSPRSSSSDSSSSSSSFSKLASERNKFKREASYDDISAQVHRLSHIKTDDEKNKNKKKKSNNDYHQDHEQEELQNKLEHEQQHGEEHQHHHRHDNNNDNNNNNNNNDHHDGDHNNDAVTSTTMITRPEALVDVHTQQHQNNNNNELVAGETTTSSSALATTTSSPPATTEAAAAEESTTKAAKTPSSSVTNQKQEEDHQDHDQENHQHHRQATTFLGQTTNPGIQHRDPIREKALHERAQKIQRFKATESAPVEVLPGTIPRTWLQKLAAEAAEEEEEEEDEKEKAQQNGGGDEEKNKEHHHNKKKKDHHHHLRHGPFTNEQLAEKYHDMDIIYTWVNGSEMMHRWKKSQVMGRMIAEANSRDRDSDELRHSMRSIALHVKWHTGRITIVSPGHVPYWLDLTNPRVRVVHQDALALDEQERFTFNTNAIEQNLWRMPAISDYFVQFNDDYFVKRECPPSVFLNEQGGPNLLYENGVVGGGFSQVKKMLKDGGKVWIASVFHTNGLMQTLLEREKRRYLKYIKHAPFTYCTSYLQSLQQRVFPGVYHRSARFNRFRSHLDVLTPFIHNGFAFSGPDILLSNRTLRRAQKHALDRAHSKEEREELSRMFFPMHEYDFDEDRAGDLKPCAPVTWKTGHAADAKLIVLKDDVKYNADVVNDTERGNYMFIALNDGFGNGKLITPQLYSIIDRWFPNKSSFESKNVDVPRRKKLPQHQQKQEEDNDETEEDKEEKEKEEKKKQQEFSHFYPRSELPELLRQNVKVVEKEHEGEKEGGGGEQNEEDDKKKNKNKIINIDDLVFTTQDEHLQPAREALDTGKYGLIIFASTCDGMCASIRSAHTLGFSRLQERLNQTAARILHQEEEKREAQLQKDVEEIIRRQFMSSTTSSTSNEQHEQQQQHHHHQHHETSSAETTVSSSSPDHNNHETTAEPEHHHHNSHSHSQNNNNNNKKKSHDHDHDEGAGGAGDEDDHHHHHHHHHDHDHQHHDDEAAGARNATTTKPSIEYATKPRGKFNMIIHSSQDNRAQALAAARAERDRLNKQRMEHERHRLFVEDQMRKRREQEIVKRTKIVDVPGFATFYVIAAHNKGEEDDQRRERMGALRRCRCPIGSFTHVDAEDMELVPRIFRFRRDTVAVDMFFDVEAEKHPYATAFYAEHENQPDHRLVVKNVETLKKAVKRARRDSVKLFPADLPLFVLTTVDAVIGEAVTGGHVMTGLLTHNKKEKHQDHEEEKEEGEEKEKGKEQDHNQQHHHAKKSSAAAVAALVHFQPLPSAVRPKTRKKFKALKSSVLLMPDHARMSYLRTYPIPLSRAFEVPLAQFNRFFAMSYRTGTLGFNPNFVRHPPPSSNTTSAAVSGGEQQHQHQHQHDEKNVINVKKPHFEWKGKRGRKKMKKKTTLVAAAAGGEGEGEEKHQHDEHKQDHDHHGETTTQHQHRKGEEQRHDHDENKQDHDHYHQNTPEHGIAEFAPLKTKPRVSHATYATQPEHHGDG